MQWLKCILTPASYLVYGFLKSMILMNVLLKNQTPDWFSVSLSSSDAFATSAACFSVSHQVCFSVSHCLLLYSAWTEQLSNYVSVTAILPLGPSCYDCTQVTEPGMVTFLACQGLAMWLYQLPVQQAAESHQLTLQLGSVSLKKAGETGPQALCPQRVWLQIATEQTRSKETVWTWERRLSWALILALSNLGPDL